LIVLLGCTIGLFFFTMEKQSGAIDQTLFRIEQLDKIDHVLLESGAKKTELQFTDGKWKVNGAYDADKRLIDVLFATIEQAVPKREISKSDSISKIVTAKGTTVSFLEGDQVVQKFVAGGNAAKTQGYFQLPDGSTYAMSIPGYRVYVSGIFEADETLFRDKRVFNFNWRNFKSLEAKFPTEPKENFQVLFKEGFFGIDGMNEVDTTKLNDYLDAVSLLDANEFVSNEKRAAYDSLLNTIPAFSIEVKDVAARSYNLDVFAPQKGKSTAVARTGKGDILILSGESLSRIAKKKQYFARNKP